jgi:hypothetical protein
MAKNTHQTSGRVAELASQTLQSNSASKTAKSLAASALSQTHTARQTGAAMESLASTVLRSDKYSAETKELAGSVLSQSNKAR